jgi:hypothetical protein
MIVGACAAPTSSSCRLANGQPAFGCYVPDTHSAIARAYGLMVLTLRGDQIPAITWFGDRAVMAWFGLPRTLHT